MGKILDWFAGSKLWFGIALGIAVIFASGWAYRAYLLDQVAQAQTEAKALSDALSASEAENETLRKVRAADASAGAVKQAENKRIDEKEAKQNEQMAKALSESPDWADEPLPDAIRNSLH